MKRALRTTLLVLGVTAASSCDEDGGPIQPLCTVTVTSPNGGESWAQGSDQAIAWTSSGSCGSDVTIQLLHDGTVSSTIAASEPDDGEYVWTVSRSDQEAGGYSIRVLNPAGGASDAGDAPFTIPDVCAVTITSPNGGESWTAGTSQQIAWTPVGECGADVTIELLRNGAVCSTIAASEPNDGAYAWTATGCGGFTDGYAIRVTDPAAGASDTGDGAFSITTPCSVSLTAPLEGETLVAGSVRAITWTGAGACGDSVKIELLHEGSVCSTVAASAVNDGYYAWTVARCAGEDGYAIRVTDLASGASDTGDGSFRIRDVCSIALTSPNGAESWVKGTTHSIAWAASGACGSNVRIELLRNGAVCTTIAASEANDGEYVWTAAQCGDAAEGYTVRVTDAATGASDESDAAFTIPESCAITVTAPQAGESWTEGTSRTIAWIPSGVCGPDVSIELLRNGAVCRTIADAEANDGQYTWSAVQNLDYTDGYSIRVTDRTSGASGSSAGVFSIPDVCLLTVTAPNRDESWTEGSAHAITWTASGACGADVKIELLRNGSVCSTIAASAPNSGEYPWTVARCGGSTNGFTVRVTDLATAASDVSDGAFEIPAACTVTVTSPNGGQLWSEGSSRVITWSSLGVCGPSVKIELLRSGSVCKTIAASEPNDGEFTWTVTQCGSFTDGYTVRVTDLTTGAIDASNDAFTIPESCALAVTAPNGGEAWTEGNSRSITWMATGACGSDVKIELLRSGTVCRTITASEPNDGQFTWAVAQCGDFTDAYTIRVTDLTSGASDASNSAFTIPNVCTVGVTAPNGGESWMDGSSRSIQWTSSGICGSSVKIELLRDGAACSTIAASTPDDGQYTWLAAQCGGLADGYTIRVTDLTSGASDASDDAFTIPGVCVPIVTAPNGGEAWTEGSNRSITWITSGACGSNVKIELLRNGTVCAVIAEAETNDGEYAWTAVQCSGFADGYTVRVTDPGSGALDASNAPFTIPSVCAVTMTAPNGGESWTEGAGQSITWTSSGACGANVKIELLRSGAVCSTIAASTANDGQYAWTATQCSDLVDGYTVRVTDLTSGASDASNGSFTIPGPCAVAVTAPNGGESWTEGAGQSIGWTSSGACGSNVKIELLRNGALCSTIAASTANDGQHTWTAAQCANFTDGYAVRVTDLTSDASDASDGAFTVPDVCTVAVTAPNGGESWTEGSNRSITWTTAGACGSNVKIELLRNGAVCSTIAASEPNDGSYSWMSAQCGDFTDAYAVRVTDLTSGASDASDGVFTVPNVCTANVTIPNGGESWTESSSHSIAWSTAGACGSNVKIELLRNGAVCSTIAASEPNDGAYDWTVAQCDDFTDGYAVRVTDLVSGASDTSDGAFTVPNVCAVAVTAPNGGESWTEGSSHSIAWTSSGACGSNVRLELLRNGAVCATIAASEPNDGQYTWSAAQCADLSDGYAVRVTDLASGASDDGDAAFSIPGVCALNLTAPNGGESWVEGSGYSILWTPSGACGSTVKIELLRNGALCSTIAASEANDGVFIWIAARCGGQSDGYTIRVTDLTSGAADASGAPFTIPEACAIQVATPNGGESWVEGSAQSITWNPTGSCGATVKIELLRNGVVCSTIAASDANDGEHTWTAAQCADFTDGYTIRVTEATSGATDASNAAFTIPEACAIQIGAPNGGESWVEGSAQSITWNSTGACGADVKIELLRNDTVCSTIAASEANDGAYAWTAAQCADSTAGYTIQVADLASGAVDASNASFMIPEACAVQVTSPDGGESWVEGSAQSITWNPTGSCGANVRIELLRNGTVCSTIGASEANDGAYAWTAAQCADSTAGYTVQVTDLASGATDASNAAFTIPEACAVQVTVPDGGESWVEGSAQSITWNPTGSCGANVRIELLRNGAVCSTIAASEANDGEYAWTAAQCADSTAGYTIQVTDLASGASDASGAPFTIPDACAVQVTSPDGGESWAEGSAQSIMWNPTGSCGANVKIELLQDGAVCSTIAASEANDGAYAWTAAQCADSTAGYTVQVTDLASGAADASNASFAITGCTLSVVSPNGGEAWTAGQDYEISWGGSPGANVRIELLENGVWCADLSASTPNDGAFTWTAVQCGGATGYSIRIIDLDYHCEDSSDAEFTVDLP